MASKNVLGRGLGAFFPENKDQEERAGESDSTRSKTKEAQQQVNVVLEVRVDNIRPNPHQPRKEFDDELLGELANSIQKQALTQPTTVRYLSNKRFELIRDRKST